MEEEIIKKIDMLSLRMIEDIKTIVKMQADDVPVWPTKKSIPIINRILLQ